MKRKQSTLKNILSLKMPSGYNKPIHLAMLLLNLFGILMVISATQGEEGVTVQSLLFTGVKELVFAVIGYIAMVKVARNFSFNAFKRHIVPITVLVIGSLLITRAFGGAGGAYAWIRFGPFTIQPSEFAKIYVIILFAVLLGDKQRLKSSIGAMDLLRFPVGVVFSSAIIIVLWQKDFGSALVMLGIAAVIFLIPTNQKLWNTQKAMMGLIVLAFILAFVFMTTPGLNALEAFGIPEYMLERFRIAANPFEDRYGGSYQLFMGIVAMVKGTEYSIFGRGYGNSINKYGYIPASNTDFIIAVIVEELGILGILFIAITYGIIVYNLIKGALVFRKERDKIVLIGCASYLLIHMTLNLGGATGLVPLTGVPLLLISAGGSGRMAFMVAIGLAQNVIARNVSLSKKIKQVQV